MIKYAILWGNDPISDQHKLYIDRAYVIKYVTRLRKLGHTVQVVQILVDLSTLRVIL